MYKRYSVGFWKGKKVITRKLLRNGLIEIPVGTVCTIRNKFSGFTLQSEPCKVCGVSIFITRVSPEEVDLL